MRLTRLIIPGRRRIAALVVAVAAIALIAVGGPAQAKVSGPNGRIVFARDTPDGQDTNTYTMNPDGSDVQPLFPAFTSGSPHWSPDGTEVAVNSGLGVPCPPTCTGNTVIVNPDTGGYRVITPEGFPAISNFCTIWSPDASRFACEAFNDNDPSVDGVYTVRSSDGGGLTRITNGPDVPIDYSPDGTQIVFGRAAHPNCTTRSALYVVNVDGSGLHRITPWGFCDDDGSWSPDGTEIAFEQGSVQLGNGRFVHGGSLFVVHPDGTGMRKIPLATDSRTFAGDVSWSPDGSKLAFILIRQVGPHSFVFGLGTANADGSDVQQVTLSPTFDHETDWGSHPLTH
ncbi:MAG TPA: hypothetical protein VI142_06150 [Gaiellaceae bacterium]